MRNDLFRVSTLCAALFTAQFATAAVSSDEDSVKSWGAWSSIATAAGGGLDKPCV